MLHHGQILIEGELNDIRSRLDLEDDSGIVEMICSVTGIDPDEISLDIARDSILPLKKIGGEEE